MTGTDSNVTTGHDSAYDLMPYPSKPFCQAHPDRLATIACLFGITPQPVSDCRVLELGCASGDNIIPMGEQLPGSSFLGIDASQREIDPGHDMLRRTGLSNVELRCADILEVDQSFGQFDYIIAHGVYSWVPEPVQDKILDICAENLAPNGIAYVSYNVYPGWHMRGMIRDMMCYHAARFDGPTTKIAQARGLLDFLAKYTPQESAYGKLLAGEVNVLKNHEDGYLFHEHLEEHNEPLYFYQFAARADAKGLAYLGEANMSAMWPGHFPEDVAQTLQKVSNDDIQMEQYMDFVRNRMFRQTLLCHEGVEIDRGLRFKFLENIYVGAPLMPEQGDHNLQSTEPMKFNRLGNDRHLTVTAPIIKAVMLELAQAWPGSVPFKELLSLGYKRLAGPPVLHADDVRRDSEELARVLLKCYLSDMVELRSYSPPVATQISDTPTASVVASAQVTMGCDMVTNLQHLPCRLSAPCRHLLPYLDGSRNHEELLALLEQALQDGTLILSDGSKAEEPARQGSGEQLVEALDAALRYLARNALLVS